MPPRDEQQRGPEGSVIDYYAEQLTEDANSVRNNEDGPVGADGLAGVIPRIA
jgi:hypothetical protein